MIQQQTSTRDWEELLSEPQQEKYANAIRQGYFDTYHGNEWRHSLTSTFLYLLFR